MSSVLISPYLDELTANIRARPIPWEGYQRASLISEDEVKRIKAIDKQPALRKHEIISAESDEYAQLVMNLLSKIKRVDILQYTLVLAGDFISEVDAFAQSLISTTDGDDMPYSSFIKLLKNEDDAIPILAANVLTYLIATTETVPASVLKPFFEWYRSLASTQDQNTDLQNLSVQALSSILRSQENRNAFWEEQENMDILIKLLKTHGGIQLQYNAMLVIWLLSFDKPRAQELNAKFDIIAILSKIAKASIKEKVTRIAVATLRNLAKLAPEKNINQMIQAELLPFLKVLTARKWQDPDIKEDLDDLTSTLTARKEEMTSFDEYVTEIESGKLSWTPPHRSEEFWQSNAASLSKDDSKLVKDLARILSTSSEPIVLAVACHDIGAFVKHYPDGRNTVQKIGAKSKVLELMASGDSELRYEALQTVQILLSKAWEK
ncbi:putative Vacuolar ATP synthase subunit H [Taphrina deformans PYCC 5710]|uniref:V-type proton ATPase subunit H n=1 Tax=Taphrina deformans (strain PYCC 5710 / ATCC 11124 / CBS 356.35 / IMI 108563 / JCM 9778 / NBRC 8474) TaxID=1097556 RepID=R4XB71_TAPDE|nr:putative Vacuolar ATP synthase subunit H [Taphrina deformans PYCC 5710]|eukprot:CCG81582.1 putative Vacuolar ATP synthase subunit H [Taphrina deformans PYCC 5710]